MKRLLQITDLEYKISSNEVGILKGKNVTILQDINFVLNKGEILAIAGESGCGKTTLAKLIAGIAKPSGGEIKSSITGNRKIQILFQNSSELLNPLRTTSESLRGINDNDTRIDEVIKFTGINRKILSQFNNTLSGGERQRVALARLLLAEPELLILDEPFSSQDPDSVSNLTELLKKINKEFKTTIICISHNLKVFKNFADNLIIMRNGRIIENGSVNTIFNNPENEYTKFLMKAENYSISRADFEL